MTMALVLLEKEDITPTDEEYGDMLVEERPEEDDEAIDKYLNMELTLGVGTDDERRGRVVKRSKGIGGDPIGRAHSNPFFDTREYDVEFTDGTTEKYAANVIAENMYAQVDDEGNMFQLLLEIMDHKKDGTAIDISRWYGYLGKWKHEAKDYDARMDVTGNVEGSVNELGKVERFESV